MILITKSTHVSVNKPIIIIVISLGVSWIDGNAQEEL
jgi:hypothetical protein